MSWAVAPDILVRTTGFPVECLQRLRMPRAAAALRAVDDAEASRDRLGRQLLEEFFPPLVAASRASADPSLKGLYDVRRAVGRRRRAETSRGTLAPEVEAAMSEWNGLLAECDSLEAAARIAWEKDLGAAREALRSLAAQPRLREAIAISNPSFLTAVERHLAESLATARSNRERRFERRLALYVQRLCAKNETTSFFGPLNYGRVDSARDRIVVDAMPLAQQQRRAYPAQWLAEAVAEAIASDPAMSECLRPRRGTLWRAEGDRLLRNAVNGAARELSPQEALIWRDADGGTAIADLARTARVEVPACIDLVSGLAEDHVLVSALLVPPDLEDPLAFLLGWLEDEPGPAADRWQEALSALADLVAQMPKGSIQERLERRAQLHRQFVALTGLDPERGAGEAYADRDLSFEECRGSLEHFVVSREFAAELAASLGPLLRLLHALAEERREAARDAARRVFEGLAGEGDRVGFLRFILAARRAGLEASGPGPLEAAFRDLVQRRQSDGLCALAGSDIDALLPPRADPVSCSIDLMLAAPNLDAVAAGEARVIVGEVHPPALLHTFPASAFNAGARKRISRLLDGSGSLAELIPARKTKLFSYPLPGPQIELRPQLPGTGAIPIAEVDVVRTESGLELEAAGRMIQLRPPLEPGEGIDVLLPFAQPPLTTLAVDLGRETPRIEIDGVVVQRRRWRISPDLPSAMAGDFERFLAYRGLARELGLPDQVFAHAPDEPKPVAVDLETQFGIEILDGLLRQSPELMLTEAEPRLEDAWLELEDGHHTSELRMLFFDSDPAR